MYVSHIAVSGYDTYILFGAGGSACRSWHGYDWVHKYVDTIRETAKNVGSISSGLFR